VYIDANNKGNRNKSGAKIRMRITPSTEPKIKPYQRTKPVTMSPVTIKFHSNLNGNKIMFLPFVDT